MNCSSNTERDYTLYDSLLQYGVCGLAATLVCIGPVDRRGASALLILPNRVQVTLRQPIALMRAKPHVAAEVPLLA